MAERGTSGDTAFGAGFLAGTLAPPPAIPSEGGVALTLPAALQGGARACGSFLKLSHGHCAERLYIGGTLREETAAMGLLAQLFRHKNEPQGGPASPSDSGTPDGAGEVRGIGAIAAAAGVRTAHGMPAEFSLSLGEIIARVPEHCVWPGGHDASRVLRIPSADVAPGLERGKPQISLARLIALAPEVFRLERGASDAPQVRLPIQKLLQQIRSDESSEDFGTDAPAMPGEDATAGPNPVTPPSPDRMSAIAAEIPSPLVKLPPPGAPEVMPSVSVNATQHSAQMLELRPSKDVSISTTLRAVVLGGITPGGSASAQSSAANVLAPRVAPATSAGEPPKVFSPSVVHSPMDAAPPRAPSTAPDFAGLRNLFMTDATLDLAGVAGLAAALPGVQACVISGSAGSADAGDFSRGVSAREMREASENLPRLGGSLSSTVHRGECDIVLFLHGEICVAALVKAGGFVPGVRERLARIAALLAGAPTTS